jgi:hypothetical protein
MAEHGTDRRHGPSADRPRGSTGLVADIARPGRLTMSLGGLQVTLALSFAAIWAFVAEILWRSAMRRRGPRSAGDFSHPPAVSPHSCGRV